MNDKERLHTLASQWRELAESPMMEERRKAWTALHDLQPIRPVCILETSLMPDFVAPEELYCVSPEARALEERLVHGIKHVNSFDDDYTLEPFLTVDTTLDWICYDFGVGLAYTINPDTHAIITNHPIQQPEDVDRLQKRTYSYSKEANDANRDAVQELLGDTMPVVIEPSYVAVPGISKFVFDLIGMDNMYYWAVDCPEVIVRLADFIADDFLTRYRFMEDNKLLSVSKAKYAGSGSLGYTSHLRDERPTTLSNMWVWMESQETETMSPDMLEELFLPAMSRAASPFGLTYYGCCEHLHDRMGPVMRHIPNIRAVSVSPWSDVDKMAAILDGKMVFSRKLNPVHIVNGLQWDALEADIDHVMKANPSGLVEFIFRDVYVFGGDMEKYQTCMKRIKSKIT
jgi:hypothetical protein